VTATFSEDVVAGEISFELVDASGAVVPSVTTYDAGTRTVTLHPFDAMEAGATYTAMLSGVRDAAGNAAAPENWSFTTATTSAPQAYDEFEGTTLGDQWTATPHNAGSTVTVGGGVAAVKATQVRSVETVTQAVEGRVQFTSRWQSFGLATNLSTASGNAWAIFGTKFDANVLYARTNVNGVSRTVDLGPTPSGLHVYRVEPVEGGFNFFVDGAKVATVMQTLPADAPVKLVMSDMIGESALTADWVRIGDAAPAQSTTYTPTGLYLPEPESITASLLEDDAIA
jgi:hypothetical protein